MPMDPLPNPKGIRARLFAPIFGTIIMIALFSSLLFFNVVQTLSLIIRLFSPTAFRRANRWMANRWWGWCDKTALKAYDIKVVTSGDSLPMRENAVVIMNHQEMTDITVMFNLARAKDRIGDLKWFVKDKLKYVPGVGWGMLFLDCLFVKRDWTSDSGYIQQVFKKMLEHRIPAWIIIFAEGTRIKPQKLADSQQFARDRGLEPPQHTLFPRTKGFVATVQAMRGGHVTAVYDFTIGYTQGVPTLWQWIKGYVPRVNVYTRRFDINDLPEQDEALEAWLIECYQEKDALLDAYYRDGVFPAALFPDNADQAARVAGP